MRAPESITHYLTLGKREIPYTVRFSKKARYLQIKINASRQIELVIPKRHTLEQGQRFLREKSDWIRRNLPPAKCTVRRFTFFGRNLRITHAYDLFLPKHAMRMRGRRLFIKSPEGSHETTPELYQAFLKFRAKDFLKKRTFELAKQHNFTVNRVSIRGQKTRWGSCSQSGTISLNYNLLRLDKKLIDYVIIHELCHLRHMNHSKDFWNEVEQILPDYKQLRKELRGRTHS